MTEEIPDFKISERILGGEFALLLREEYSLKALIRQEIEKYMQEQDKKTIYEPED